MSASVPVTDSGVEVLRRALLNRRFKGHLALLSRDHKVGLATLEEFADGSARLPAETLDALAKELLGPNVTYLADRDKLYRTKAPTTPLTAPGYPPAAPTGQLPINTAGQGMPPSTEKPKPKGPRPGWT